MKVNLDKLDLTLILDGKEIDLKTQATDELRLSEELINDNLKDQPGMLAFYVMISEMAHDAVRTHTLELELVEATVAEGYRNKLLKSGEKVTDKRIETLVKLDKNRIESVKSLNKAKKNSGILKGLVRAFEHRKESAIALASNMRAQIDPEVYIKKKELEQKS